MKTSHLEQKIHEAGGWQPFAFQELAARLEPKRTLDDSPYRTDPHTFVFNCCYTIDEADPSNKLKRIPDLPHIRLMIQRILIDRIHPLMIPKSRRMVVSWTATACEVHETYFNTHRAVFVQSKKFEDSCELVGRHWHILKMLPRDEFPIVRSTEEVIEWENGLSVKRYRGGRAGTALLEFSNGSSIRAVAEGADQLRQYAATMIRQEEIAFWDRQEESYDAAVECVQASASAERGGQLVGITTANPSWTGDFIHDKEQVEGRREGRRLDIHHTIEGVREWETSVGLNVLEIHYTADPDKRNPEWIKAQKKGKRTRGWNREMEIMWDVFEGMPVFGDCFNERLHVSPDPLEWDGRSTIVRAWDYGNTPACTFSTLVNGQWLWLGEIVTDTRPLGAKEPPKTTHISELANEVLQYCALRFPGARYEDFDDPSGDAKSPTDGRSCRDILRGYGITPRGGEVTVKGRLNALADWFLKLVNGEPAVLIDEGACPMSVEGLKGGYRYAEIGQTGRYNEQPEKNQYSHPLDAWCYAASRLGFVTNGSERSSLPKKGKPNRITGY